ncbi:MAG: DUF2808 domain-containing protein [Microcoleaceae cyanobacterium MO_207.B10]|nr:DUF2808 domain-containing protein [Microcoleaceae cyanobacterium MO_207.B10]
MLSFKVRKLLYGGILLFVGLLLPYKQIFVNNQTLAIELQDGTVYFAEPPRLVKAVTTRSETYVWSATYYFTLSLSPDAGVPLERVSITKTEGGGKIRYNPDQTIAFEGTHRDKGQKLTVGEVAIAEDADTVSVTFNPPLAPGQTVTIGLRPVRTPKYGGIYLFGVTAFPAGEKSHGHFLGYGRLHFYDGSDHYD